MGSYRNSPAKPTSLQHFLQHLQPNISIASYFITPPPPNHSSTQHLISSSAHTPPKLSYKSTMFSKRSHAAQKSRKRNRLKASIPRHPSAVCKGKLTPFQARPRACGHCPVLSLHACSSPPLSLRCRSGISASPCQQSQLPAAAALLHFTSQSRPSKTLA